MSFLKSHLGMARWRCVRLIPEFFTYPKVNPIFLPMFHSQWNIYSEHMETPAFPDTHTRANKRNSSNMAPTLQTTSDDQIGSPRSPIFFRSNMAQWVFLPKRVVTSKVKGLGCCFTFPGRTVSGTRGTWTWQWLELDHPLQWRSSEGSNDTVDSHTPREWWETRNIHNSSSNWVLQMYVKSFYPSSRLVVHLHSSSHPSKHLHRYFLYHFDISRT